MADVIEPDLCVIGAGAAGLSVAAGAVQMGATTALVERSPVMGGDCLNVGCVPSKALLAAGHAAAVMRTASRFGIARGAEPEIDFAKVHKHVHDVIAKIAPMDSQERFEGLGVRVIREHARFTGPREMAAGDTRIRARRFVLATGSRPVAPPIPGLDDVRYLTNETVFTLTERPTHLIVIGAGPIGTEMAQAHRRLGADVSLIDIGPLLPKDDPDLVAVIRARLVAEGVEIHEQVEVERVEPVEGGVAVHLRREQAPLRIAGSHLLIAAGRAPVTDGLDLEAAGIDYDKRGITTDQRLRTSNKHVFAIGDVAGHYQFTHVCSYHAGIVIKNALFRLPSKVDYRALPWVTYTDPELAQVGQSEAAARDAGHDVQVLRWSFEENDRAQAERETEGLIKIVIRKGGRILGASIAGPRAGELITPFGLAIAQKLKVGALANLIVPYPTFGEVGKRAAGSFYTPTLFSPRTRWIVRLLAKLG